MIFKVKHDEKVRDTNPGIDAIPEFSGIPDKVLKYTFLMFDYFSPYNRLPESIRREQVLINLGYTNSGMIKKFASNNKQYIETARKILRKISYDPQLEALISCKIQLSQWDDLLRKESKNDKEQVLAQKILDKLPSYLERVEKIEEIVGFREKFEDGTDEGKTALERYMDSK